jgi:hypothetical protein
VVTHGHLSENDNHGGRRLPGLDDPLRMLSGIGAASVAVEDFVYGRGDLSVTTAAGRPPTVREGGTLTFRNLDSPRSGDPNRAVYHTITSCRAPGNRETGIAYPLADGPVVFDSSEPGFGPPGGHRRGEPRDVAHAEGPRSRHLHVLLPRAPVHARRVPRRSALKRLKPGAILSVKSVRGSLP